MKPPKQNKDRVQVTLHPILRRKGEVVATRRGLSFSEYLERVIEEDLRAPRPSVYEEAGGYDTKTNSPPEIHNPKTPTP